MSNVQVGQVWSDKDKRRAGRKFEIVNIDQGLADCVMVAGGTREKTKIRLDRFKPKYYVLKGTAQGPLSKTAKSKVQPKTAPPAPKTSGTELSDACAKVLGGNWGGFGSYALFDNSKVHIIIRLVRTNCYDVKVRLSGHLVYSSVSRADLDTTLGQVRSYLKSLRDNISDVVG
jgi:hypothetical protein